MNEKPREGIEAAREIEKQPEKEKLRRLWATLFLRAAEESFKWVDPLDKPDSICREVEADPDDFKTWLRSKRRFEWAVHTKSFARAQRDYDVKVVLWLLEKAGIDISNIEDVPLERRSVKDKINIDFGGVHGIKIPYGEKLTKGDRTVIVDHHPNMRLAREEISLTTHPEDWGLITRTSASQQFFEGLDSLGLFEEEDREALKRMAEFVTQMDNKNYPGQHNLKTFRESCRTVLGLYQYTPLEKLYEYFKRGKSPTDILKEDELREIGLIYKTKGRKKEGKIVNRSEERKKMIEDGLKMVKDLEQQGFVVEIRAKEGKPLRFLVDYIHEGMDEKRKQGIPLRVDAVLASGFDGVIVYDQSRESYFVNLNPELPRELDLDLKGGINVRGKMFIRDVSDTSPLKISLREMIEALEGDFSKIGKGLEWALRENDHWIETEIVDVDASQIQWSEDRKGKGHWGLPSGHGRKHGIITQGLPPDFNPKNEEGTRIQLRIYKDTKPDDRRSGAYLLKVIQIQRPRGYEGKIAGIIEAKIYEVEISIASGVWEAILLNGQRLRLPQKPEGEEFYDVHYRYKIWLKSVEGRLTIVRAQRGSKKD